VFLFWFQVGEIYERRMGRSSSLRDYSLFPALPAPATESR
jgi:hypothetical protein